MIFVWICIELVFFIYPTSSNIAVNVVDYEEAALRHFNLGPGDEATNVLNFTESALNDFLHVELELDCKKNASDDGSVQFGFGRNLGHEVKPYVLENWSEFPQHRISDITSQYTWVMRFSLRDCLNIYDCIFFIVIKASTFCTSELRVKRGWSVNKLGLAQFQIKPLHGLVRLFEYNSARHNLKIRILAHSRWTIDFVWGYTLKRHRREGVGDETVSISAIYEEQFKDERLLLWFHSTAGIYGLDFIEFENEDITNMQWIFIGIFAACLFCCIFCMVFCITYYILVRVFKLRRRRVIVSLNTEGADTSQSPMPLRATSTDIRNTTKLDTFVKEGSRVCQFRNNACVICLEEFVPGDIVRILGCDHLFHKSCIDTWLMSTKNECPICHQKINEAQCFFKSTTSNASTSLMNSIQSPAALPSYFSKSRSRSGNPSSLTDVLRSNIQQPGYKIILVKTTPANNIRENSEQAPYLRNNRELSLQRQGTHDESTCREDDSTLPSLAPIIATVHEVENDSDSESNTFVFGQVVRTTLSDLHFEDEDNLGEMLFLKPELIQDKTLDTLEQEKRQPLTPGSDTNEPSSFKTYSVHGIEMYE